MLERKTQGRETRVSGSPNPTALEYQAAYWQLLSAVHNSSNRLLVVVDNLDRLPAAEARELWAMLRTFLVGAPPKQYSDVPAPAIIVPVALEAMAGIYGQDNGTSQAEGFMQKTFDAVFHVPRPLFTQWQDYFCTQLARSLGHSLDDEENHAVRRILDEHVTRRGEAVTPRFLNTLANLVAAYAIQTRDEHIALSSIIYYGLNKAGIDADVVAAVSGKPGVAAALGDNWTDAIAVLHFGIPRREAVRALLETPLSDALLKGHSKPLEKLLGVHGADQVLMRVLTRLAERPSLDGKSVVHIMQALSQAKRLTGSSRHYACSQVAPLIERASDWPATAKNVLGPIERFVVSADRASHSAVLVAVEQQLANAPLSTGDEAPRALGEFWRRMSDDGGLPRQLPSIRIPGDVSTFINVAVAAAGKRGLPLRLVPMCPVQDVVLHLANALGDEATFERSRSELLAVLPLLLDAEWKPLADMALQLLHHDLLRTAMDEPWHPSDALTNAILGLAMLHDLHSLDGIQLSALVEGVTLSSLLDWSLHRGYPDVAGSLVGLMLILKIRPALDVTANPELRRFDEDSHVHFTGALERVLAHGASKVRYRAHYTWPLPPGDYDLVRLLNELDRARGASIP